MVLYIDMDDCIVNLSKAVIDEMNREFNINYDYRDNTSYWWLDTGKTQEYFEDVLCRKGVFKYAQPIMGAGVNIDWLHQKGINIIFLTTPHYENPHCVNEKVFWLKHQFKWFDPYKHLICTNRKDLVGTKDDILIDDNPNHIKGFKGVGICYAQKFNEDYKGIRMGDWNKITDYIMKLEREY